MRSLQYVSCADDVCSCNGYEDKNCNICYSAQGCSQCEYGYVKIGANYPCVECQLVFGDGYIQCEDGYETVKDNCCRNGANYCKTKDCNNNDYPTPRT